MHRARLRNRNIGGEDLRPLTLFLTVFVLNCNGRDRPSMNILPHTTIRPRRLCPGDLLGVVAPASPAADLARVEAGVRYFEKNGYRVRVGKHAGSVYGYLAGTDEERVADLHAMAADPEVRAILCLRGGYGTTRLLPLLEYELFRRDPKVLVGFSDITALQLALWHRCRLVTFHGPMVSVDFSGNIDPAAEQSFWDAVGGAGGDIVLGEPGTLSVLGRGRTEGTLLGGNLSLMAALAGTPYMPDFSGAIVMMEEIGEEPYRIDRMLTQLAAAGVFQGVRGIAAGQFSDCLPKDPSRPSLSVEDLLGALSRTLAVPFNTGCRFGHVSSKVTIPIGLQAGFDATRGRLTLVCPAVE